MKLGIITFYGLTPENRLLDIEDDHTPKESADWRGH
jgi:hypothetical protein